MNRNIAIFSLLFFLSGSLSAQGTEEDLDQMRNWFREINANINQFKMIDLSNVAISRDTTAENYSVEGAETYRPAATRITKFFDGGELVKLVITFDGDREALISAYYFRAGDLFFVDKTKTIYHRPKWHNEFDASELSTTSNHFYVKDHSLLKWVDSNLLSIGKSNPYFAEQEKTILSDAHLYLAIN
ncbi:MAG: hypothetical protein WBA23_20930 [Tunicatimonas sp.]|uniref:hypothetical protein n=1 Tax=Tunicatimonas sp. TaxID=1940096 RepID=UPI003C754550